MARGGRRSKQDISTSRARASTIGPLAFGLACGLLVAVAYGLGVLAFLMLHSRGSSGLTANEPLAASTAVPKLPAKTEPADLAPTATVVFRPDLQTCVAAHIQATVNAHFVAYTMGQLGTWIYLRNRFGAPCRVSGYPDLQALDGHGDVIPLTVSSPCDFKDSRCLVPFADVVLAPGTLEPEAGAALPEGQATFELEWPSYGDQGPPCRPAAVEVAIVRLSWTGSQGSVDAKAENVRPCRGVSLTWFQATVKTP